MKRAYSSDFSVALRDRQSPCEVSISPTCSVRARTQLPAMTLFFLEELTVR